CPAGRRGPRPRTRPRPACRGRAREAPRGPARRSLFERLLRRLARLRVPRPDRDAAEAEPAQDLADRALVRPDREAGLDQGLQVGPPGIPCTGGRLNLRPPGPWWSARRRGRRTGPWPSPA